jgi:RNA polymerase sigma factor (TIGR02999 family)
MDRPRYEPTGLAQEFCECYDELRAAAARQLRSERPNHTLRATALVHEAYVRLRHSAELQWSDRTHFLSLAARTMRQVLVDYARSRGRAKRGGTREPILVEEWHLVTHRDIDIEALDEALARLEALDPRQGQIVEMRFFAGMSVEEVAEALSLSPKTVKRDWAMARTWLKLQLAGAGTKE